MFASIRSRLWLSYILVIGMVIIGVTGAFLSGINQSPLLYRQPILKLRLGIAALETNFTAIAPKNANQVQKILENHAKIENMRFVILNRSGNVVADSGLGIEPPIPQFPSPPIVTGQDPIAFSVFRDNTQSIWLYVLRPLDDGNYLMATSRRKSLDLGIIFRDEIIAPMLRGSLIVLFPAFILGLVMSAWIGNPLKRLTDGARQIESGRYPILPREGPRDVQELAESFNQMSKRVQRTEVSQRDFLVNVSHELKTPLTSIQGFSQSILDGAAKSPQEIRKSVDVIYSEASRMHRLVLDLLTLSKLEGGTADLQFSPVNLSRLLVQIVEKMRPQITTAGLTVSRNIKPDQIALGDEDKLSQVFINLMDNAIKFTPSGGKIELQVKAEELWILVSLTDTGKGIPEKEENRIFERFYQVDKSRKGGPSRGIGLGLSIAWQIVEAHKGELWVESVPNSGSAFFVRLPSQDMPTLKVNRDS